MTDPVNPSIDTTGVPQDPGTHGGTTQIGQVTPGAAGQNVVSIVPENQDGAAGGTHTPAAGGPVIPPGRDLT